MVTSRGEAEGEFTPEGASEPRPGRGELRCGETARPLSARGGSRLERKGWQENRSRLAPTGGSDDDLPILNFKLH